MEVELDPRRWELHRASVRAWVSANWLLLAGAVWVIGGFAFASQFVIVYNRQAFVRTSIYIALEVVGWTAVSVWLSGTFRETEFVERLGRLHYDVRNRELDDRERRALAEFIAHHYDDARLDAVADGGSVDDGGSSSDGDRSFAGVDTTPDGDSVADDDATAADGRSVGEVDESRVDRRLDEVDESAEAADGSRTGGFRFPDDEDDSRLGADRNHSG